jgi:predicted fused transcriptional regulator/phosphomethylpyrimidine kinase
VLDKVKDPESERNDALYLLEEAAVLLEGTDPRLIPAAGLSVGYAIRGARDSGDIAGVSDGIRQGTKHSVSAGTVAFGVDAQIARIILTTMKFDTAVRSAAILRYSPVAIGVLESMFLECATFDPARVPPGISTMDWGVASCCEDGVPDVIYTKDYRGAEGIVRILGEDPVVVANNILILSNRVLHSEL